MARRTKEEAQETRTHLLDAAEHLFQAQGVSRTSLQDIARRAGTTRGAVYWHFKDKADLFNAMMDRITLPMEEAFSPQSGLDTQQANANAAPQIDSGAQTLERIRQAMLSILNLIVNDPQTRRVLEVATHKVEYVEDLMAVRQRHLNVRSGFLLRVEQSLQSMLANQPEANAANPPLLPAMAAQGMHALIDGLVQNWLLDPKAFDLLKVGQYAIDVYLRGLGIAR